MRNFTGSGITLEPTCGAAMVTVVEVNNNNVGITVKPGLITAPGTTAALT